jgi:hypothetical protein
LLCLSSCGLNASNTAILWTDRPEFALYAEYFNASQSKYKVEIRYFESPALNLNNTGDYPDIVVSSWIKSTNLRTFFRPFDSILKRNTHITPSFYPQLLELGNHDSRQFLLPVSFNIPAIVFAHDYSHTHANQFIIELDEIKERSRAFNRESAGVYTRMGFLPSTNDEFLYVVTALFGTAFQEAWPLGWEARALEDSITWIKNFISEANTSIQAESDFSSKYFNAPPDNLIKSGRILYTYMDSSGFFTLLEEQRSNLDYRWIASREMIPVNDGNVYLGIHRRTKALKAANAFTLWFFNKETQKMLMEAVKSKRLNETVFGISGGFSAMKTVTEQVFPQFYPDLLGHTPPEDFLASPYILPRNWPVIKGRVILPYIREKIRHSNPDELRSLERRVSDWYRINRE